MLRIGQDVIIRKGWIHGKVKEIFEADSGEIYYIVEAGGIFEEEDLVVPPLDLRREAVRRL